jgi:hypothetical protein
MSGGAAAGHGHERSRARAIGFGFSFSLGFAFIEPRGRTLPYLFKRPLRRRHNTVA